MKFGADVLREIAGPHHMKARRKAWNEGNYIYYCEGQYIPVDKWIERSKSQSLTPFEKSSGFVQIVGHIDNYCDGKRIVGWTPDKEDVEGDDWEIIE